MPALIDRLARPIVAIISAFALLANATLPARAQQAGGDSLPIIRDAEIEGLLRLYTKPIFKAAGINPGSARVYIIQDDHINAFVAGGQRIFINTGLLMQANTPNQVIGVLAHETGHIAGGHLARMGNEADQASATAIIGMLLGVAAMAGGALSKNPDAGRAGTGIMIGSQSLAQRSFLTYARSMESSADQAALKFLNETHQSAKGMLELFTKLSRELIAQIRDVDPYVLSHPMPLERIRNLETAAKASPYYNAVDPPALVLRHELMQAKLVGFIEPANVVFQRYPSANDSLPARYARAIAMFRQGDTKNAVAVIDTLIRDLPQSPYFWELKGQAILEGGDPAGAVEPLERAVKMLPNGLLQILLAQALIGTGDQAESQEALRMLRLAQKTEGQTPEVFKFMAIAYGNIGDVGRAELATARMASLLGDKKLAIAKAKSAQSRLKTGSPEWVQANDILNALDRN
ncbi:M48 family metalloprotease [Aestuariivirga sp.]|uniref:M48 family metalloprotease n=1 Tax=Aestuariivirga sp. TaxID=2650926 RepID=UPI0039E2DCE9